MTSFFWIVFSFLSLISWSQDFDSYCKKTLKEKVNQKKREVVCMCVSENYKSLLNQEEKAWLITRSHKNLRGQSAEQNRLLQKEFEVFKNCSSNYKYKANSDDLGVPDDTFRP